MIYTNFQFSNPIYPESKKNFSQISALLFTRLLWRFKLQFTLTSNGVLSYQSLKSDFRTSNRSSVVPAAYGSSVVPAAYQSSVLIGSDMLHPNGHHSFTMPYPIPSLSYHLLNTMNQLSAFTCDLHLLMSVIEPHLWRHLSAPCRTPNTFRRKPTRRSAKWFLQHSKIQSEASILRFDHLLNRSCQAVLLRAYLMTLVRLLQ